MIRTILAALCALFAANAAFSQETVTWSDNVAGWKVNVDRTIGDSCFIIAAFENDYVVRFQFNNRQKNVQFIIGSLLWGSLEEGASYDMEVAFGERPAWSGEGVGYRWNDILPTLVLSVPVEGEKASHFIDEFAGMPEVRVTSEGLEIAKLALSGADQAVAEMMACQATMLSNSHQDPFASLPQKPAESL